MARVKGIRHIFSLLNGDQTEYTIEEEDIIFCGGVDGTVYLETVLKFNGQDLTKLHSDIFMVKKSQKNVEDYSI